MKLTEKQLDFAEFMIKNIVEAVSPIFKSYVDKSISDFKAEILVEVKKLNNIYNEKLLENKSKNIKENTKNIARKMFFDTDASSLIGSANNADLELRRALDEMKEVSPKVDGNMLGLDLSEFSNPGYTTENNLNTKLGLDIQLPEQITEEVTIESIQKKVEQLNDSIINGTHNPTKNILDNLINKDYSSFLD